MCLLQAETRSDWVTSKSVNPHSGAFVAYRLTSQQLPGQGHYRIKERAEGILFFADAIDLGLYLKVAFTGKDLQSDLDDRAAPLSGWISHLRQSDGKLPFGVFKSFSRYTGVRQQVIPPVA